MAIGATMSNLCEMSPSYKKHESFYHEEWNPRCQRHILLGFLNLLTPLIFIFLVNEKRKENINEPNKTLPTVSFSF